VRTVVVGEAGYIGRVVSAHLLRAGHHVTVVDDLGRGHDWAVPQGADLRVVDLSRPADQPLRRLQPAVDQAIA
jgi:UDP-glucose 4-epimerase